MKFLAWFGLGKSEHEVATIAAPAVAAVSASTSAVVDHAGSDAGTAPTPAAAATEATPEEPTVLLAFPVGHFYSPVVDPATLLEQESRYWPGDGHCLGIDFNPASHLQLLAAISTYMPLYQYGEEPQDDLSETPRFSHANDQFGWLDSRALFGLLNHFRPRNLIEIGGGYSTLLTADVNHRLLGDSINFISIEPYPRPFLEKGFAGFTRLIKQQVQDVSYEVFDVLGAGDILFIDSSHVAKTGSDVTYLVFEILPRLQQGVLIHVHDIYLPYEYPRHWVIDDNRSWNEQYVLRALLMYSTTFEVLFGSNYAFRRYPEQVGALLGFADRRAFGGGSLWLRKLA